MKKDVYELSKPQQSIWLTEQYFKDTNINRIICFADFSPKTDIVDFTLLKKAINHTLKSNDVFQLRLFLDNGTVKQYLCDFEEFDFPLYEIKSIDDFADAECNRHDNFNLFDCPLFEMKLFKFEGTNTGGILANFHHIICDAITTALFIRQIAECYNSLIENNALPELNPDNYSYMQYLDSEKEYSKSEKFLKDKAYFDKMYETIPEVATIFSNKPSKNDLNPSANRLTFEINTDLMIRINKLCAKLKISSYNFFMSIFGIYISRASRLNDFVIGTPILNRTNYREKNTLGMFISTMPFRMTLDNKMPFNDFASGIAKDTMSMLRHQRYSYQYILENLRKKDSNIPNLYSILLSYQINKASDESTNYTTGWAFNKAITDDLDIHIYDFNTENVVNISYDYNVNKYSMDDISLIHPRILHIINQVLENNNILLEDIDIATPNEKKLLIDGFNNANVPYKRDRSVISLFEEQVNLNPNNPCVNFDNKTLTYKELNDRANSLANLLKSKNISAGDSVALYLDKSLEVIVAIVATLKLGACYLPLDISYPADRINYILKDANAKVFLTSTNLHFGGNLSIPKILIDLSSPIYEKDTNFLSYNSKPLDIAYIIYTSGSTGKPKGVMVPNRAIVRLVNNTNYVTFSKGDRILQTGSIAFDASTFEIWGALLNGLELFLLKKSDLLNPTYFGEYIEKNKISTLFLTTALFHKFCEVNPKMFSPLKYLFVGGEASSYRHFKLVKDSNPNLIFSHVYGPTENTTFSTYYEIRDTSLGFIPIGFPIANSTCYVVSTCDTIQPVGTPGELWVGGDGLALGYLNRDDLNKDKFIKNPFGDGNIYKTGDLVYQLPNGAICYIGRIDNQIKLRGFRIELSEIDSHILGFPGVKESITVVNSGIIYSYIVCSEAVTVSELEKYLREILPTFMMPSSIIILDAFPLNANGKVDKKRLPAPSLSLDEREIVPARNNIDEYIISELKQILNLDKISIKDSFFNIGGDSLSAISLCTHLSDKFNLSVSVKDIFNNPIIENLADYVSNKNIMKISMPISKVEKRSYYPTSSAQKRIYLASYVKNASTLYNICGGILFDEKPDIGRLQNVVNTLVSRHSSLRTYFEIVDGDIVQRIVDNIDVKIELIDANINDTNELFKLYQTHFDLSKAPLFKVLLCSLPNGKTLLMLNVHHIVFDGTSLNNFMNELSDLYNGKTLNDLPISYVDYAVWENEQLASDGFKNSRDFWISQFSDNIPILNMPSTYARPATKSYVGDTIVTYLSEDTTSKINDLAKKYNVTPFMVLLSVYYILLYKYSGQDDIVVGTPISGRNKMELLDLIGMFVNSLALKAHIDSSMSFSLFLNAVSGNCIDAFNHQDYPFDNLVSDLHIPRDSSRNPVFDTMFTYQNNGFAHFLLNDNDTELCVPNLNTSKFDISLEVVPLSNNLKLSFEYCTALFDSDFVTSFAKHYENILNSVLDCPDLQISNICILGDEEKNKILNDFNNTKMDYPEDRTIVSFFDEQALKTPHNVALIFEDTKYTYLQLSIKANQLAQYLLENDIKKNDIVGIMVKRSPEMIIAILAVLKIGAAYLPIDPEYPIDRINYMLNDSKASTILVHSDTLNLDIKSNCKKINISFIRTLSYYHCENIDYSKPEDLIYLIYTSGSTGKPKGVMLTHKNITNFVLGEKRHISFDYYKVMVSLTTICFDIFGLELWGPLTSGIPLVLANEEEQVSPYKFEELCRKNHVTMVQTTPSRFLIFMSGINNNHSFWNNFTDIMVGGEAFPKTLLDKFRTCTNANIFNMYGPTETTVWSTIKDLSRDNFITIGKPIANTYCYILDKDKNPCPIGVPGDLYISGDGVGYGYNNRDDLTKERFISDIFRPNNIMYKTGDLAKYLPNGDIYCIGRIDTQVKVRGFRIELGEIENCILKYPNIEKCTVIADADNNNRQFIIAYILVNDRISFSKLRAFLRKQLPKYMVPTYFIILDDFPYLNNGKIDKKALPKANTNLLAIEVENFVAPSTDLEVKIANVFQDLLSFSPIGINDNFFELGGDSLLAINLQIELLKQNINITYADIFMYPTVKELAKYISSSKSTTLTTLDTSEFSKFDTILNNNIYLPDKLTYKGLGNILLTGATGFLGAHVLDCFLQEEKGIAYCLVRSESGLSLKDKLIRKLHFYFGNKYDKLVGSRIIIVNSDISYDHLGLTSDQAEEIANNISCVINCAAKVSHFGDYNVYKKINVDGVQNLLDFCMKYGKRFYHISTLSVSGNNLIGSADMKQSFDNEVVFNESNFYINQVINNVYVRSKFEAEELIFKYILKGLDAYILRIGNLMNRYSDGKFQPNVDENAFVNRLISFFNIGCIPDYLINQYLEFTPVDSCAKAIIKIAEYPTKNNRVFHLDNKNYVSANDFLRIVKSRVPFSVVSDKEFNDKINSIFNEKDFDIILSGILRDFDNNKKLVYDSKVNINSDFTINYLKKLGFTWPIIDDSYLIKFLTYFDSIGYIDWKN